MHLIENSNRKIFAPVNFLCLHSEVADLHFKMGFRRRVGGKLNSGLRNQWTRDQGCLPHLRGSHAHAANLSKSSECINKFGDFWVHIKLRLS